MPLNSYLRQKFGGGSKEYYKQDGKDYLFNRDNKSLTAIGKKKFIPQISTPTAKAKSISSGKEGSAGIPMKMLKSKFILAARRG